MNAPHGGDAQKPQGLPVVAVVIGALFFIGLLGLMAYGVMRSGDADRDVLPSALINRPAPDFVLPVLHDPSVTIAAAGGMANPAQMPFTTAGVAVAVSARTRSTFSSRATWASLR